MAILAKIGTAATTGGQATSLGATLTGDWTIERVTTGGKKVDNEELINEDGALLGILVYQRAPLIEFTLVSAGGTAANLITMFPMGALSVVTELTDYLVENLSVEVTKSAVRGSVSLRKISASGVFGVQLD